MLVYRKKVVDYEAIFTAEAVQTLNIQIKEL